MKKIRITATKKDVKNLAQMVRQMYKELQPNYATDDIKVYKKVVKEALKSPIDRIYIHKDGFFQVRDESEPTMPDLKRYNGVRVFIKPHARNGRLLANFYKRLFADYPEGDILGMTESNSKHIPIMDKRHIEVARIYVLDRSRG